MAKKWYKVEQQKETEEGWVIVAQCMYRAHALAVIKDCEARWPNRKFRSNTAIAPD